ncbi:MAG: hypothetical protein IJR48_06720 [Oscillibacter sp.]|nr:hypothetical protein [Oscillibacter sp.]MBQ9618043.1 hypothetical protein [Oscillibacter sp.]
MALVKLSGMPKARTVHTFRFPALNGGLNLRDAEINLKDNESPEIVNLWWDDGVLQSRPGGVVATIPQYGAGSYSGYNFSSSDVVYAAATFPEGVVAHIGSSFYTWHGSWRELRQVANGGTALYRGIPRNAGTFFRFGNDLYYKNVGGFYKLAYNSGHSFLTSPFTLSRVADTAFIPTILINADPATGSGDMYQPENALSPRKRVSYNAAVTTETVIQTGNGTARIFSLDKTRTRDHLQGVKSVYINDGYIEPALYEVDTLQGVVLFNSAPPEDSTITFTLNIGVLEYHLPVDNVGAVTRVAVDGLEYTAGAANGYTVDLAAGIVTFTSAPPVSDPPRNNTVEITYSKTNSTAMNAVMNCPYAAVYGTGHDLCVVVGGAATAPNQFYWSGTTQNGIDISYWPVLNYNLADSEITGFAKQYDQMFVFQRDKIGKLDASTESVNGRDTVSLAYTGVNDTVGCDLPQSVQLIENNLTFANKAGGVYQILSASAAYENNVQCISKKVNGSSVRPGLLYDLTVAGNGPVCSLDDGKRYWLAVNGHVWLWDYSISTNADPVWFFFDSIDTRALSMRDGEPCFFNARLEVVRMSGQVFTDGSMQSPVIDGKPFRKVYQFPVRNFGGYDRLKDVLTLIVSARADTPTDINVIYETDYESRADLIHLSAEGYDRLTDRNLEVRDLSVPRHAVTFRRRPDCKHVRHFALRFETDADAQTGDPGHNLAVYSAELQYRFVGRDR